MLQDGRKAFFPPFFSRENRRKCTLWSFKNSPDVPPYVGNTRNVALRSVVYQQTTLGQ